MKWRSATLNVTVIALVAAVAVSVRLAALTDRPFTTDEADYVRAFADGFLTSYLGSRERSGTDFAREVVSEYKRTGWARPFQRDWARGDLAGLRHYHPPVGLYPLGVLGQSTRDERTLRLVALITGVLVCLSAAGLGALLAESHPRTAALTAGLLVAISPYQVIASTEVSFHPAFMLFLVGTLAGLTATIRTRRLLWWHVSSALMGLTLLTLPYWLLLLPAYLWTWWRIFRTPRSIVTGLLTLAGAVLLAWPPFFLHAAAVKPVLMYGGIILRPLAGDSTPAVWVGDLVESHWLLSAVVVVGACSLMARRPSAAGHLVPAFIYCGLFVVLNARVAHMKPLYVADVLPAVVALAAATAASTVGVIRQGMVLAVLVVALATTRQMHQPESMTDWRTEMAEIASALRGTRVLVTPRPAGAMVKYYMPETEWVLDSENAADVADIIGSVRRGEIQGVLQWGGTFEPGGVARTLVAGLSEDNYTILRTPVRVYRFEQDRKKRGE